MPHVDDFDRIGKQSNHWHDEDENATGAYRHRITSRNLIRHVMLDRKRRWWVMWDIAGRLGELWELVLGNGRRRRRYYWPEG